MAIDPSIALQGNNKFGPDWGVIQSQQQLNQAQQQLNQNIANQQAALPGITADAQQKVRANNAQQWLIDNSQKYQDANGQLNMPSLVNGLASAGYNDEASSVLAHHLNNNILATADTAKKIDMTKGAQENIANILSGLPVDKANSLLNNIKTGYNLIGSNPYSTTKVGDDIASKFYAYDNQGNIIKDQNGLPAVDIAKVSAYKAASMSPEVQNSIEQYKLANHTTPQSLDPGSAVSRATHQLAVNLGLANTNDAPQSDFYWNSRPDFANAVKNNVSSTDLLTSQKLASQGHEANKVLSQTAITALENTPLMNNAQWKGGARLADIINTLQNDPTVGAFKSILEKAKAIDPTIDETKQDGPTILAKLKAINQYNGQMSDLYTSRISPTISPVTGVDTSSTFNLNMPFKPTSNIPSNKSGKQSNADQGLGTQGSINTIGTTGSTSTTQGATQNSKLPPKTITTTQLREYAKRAGVFIDEMADRAYKKGYTIVNQ